MSARSRARRPRVDAPLAAEKPVMRASSMTLAPPGLKGTAVARRANANTARISLQPTSAAGTPFRARAGGLLATRWHLLTAATAVGHLSLFLVPLASLRATGRAHRYVPPVSARCA